MMIIDVLQLMGQTIIRVEMIIRTCLVPIIHFAQKIHWQHKFIINTHIWLQIYTTSEEHLPPPAHLNPTEASFSQAVTILDDTADQASPAACQRITPAGLRRNLYLA